MIKRAILKLSGELFGEGTNHISFSQYDLVANKLIKIQQQTGVELAIVVGGGNIFRGREASSNVDHTEADSMGMLSTIVNGIGLREAMVRNGATSARLMTSISIPQVAEPYIRLKARDHLNQGRLVIISGGLGMPNFTTDSAVAQFADELECEIVFKGSTVDGVYSADPKKDPTAKRFDNLSFQLAIEKRLKVMDTTAFAMCEKSNIPIFIFNINDLDKLPQAISGDYSFGTLLS